MVKWIHFIKSEIKHVFVFRKSLSAGNLVAKMVIVVSEKRCVFSKFSSRVSTVVLPLTLMLVSD